MDNEWNNQWELYWETDGFEWQVEQVYLYSPEYLAFSDKKFTGFESGTYIELIKSMDRKFNTNEEHHRKDNKMVRIHDYIDHNIIVHEVHIDVIVREMKNKFPEEFI